ncbi:hypothetical protein DSM14862_02127 [Sulfitobacter indolifex]|uniref:Rap1a immunity protein domain-containing protein n=1 Tax=Sulfitobacter indolifex HEL-45 TaxID=391624 RepID=A0ABP2D8D0_9RHOB|nr:Rap1a/Tai family immunity protein [Sulfitobacter indolifex]EDQ04494.1 hypothetical protein OIHEL45_16234 [Sulfitobacter indolifex HEL-45]UOA19332.1 hypothetical protein DSM14862_02127 [Sulfitobacter indolifex]
MKPVRKSTSILCAALVIVAFSPDRGAAEVGYKTIGDLRENCQFVSQKWEELDKQEMIQFTDCASFLKGVSELMMTMCRSNEVTVPPMLKADPNHTMRAIAQGFLNWADENPRRWSDPRQSGVYEAISSQFPCEN